MPNSVKFYTPYSRKIPDPVNKKITRYIFFVPVNRIPSNIPNDPNPRKPFDDQSETHFSVYRNVENHLLKTRGTPGTFHLKNKGITVICKSVKRIDESYFNVTFDTNQGILDGGTTYRIILNNKEKIESFNDQYVKFELLTGIENDFLSEIAEALNSSIQVQDKTMDNYKGDFDWIKEEIKNQRYAEDIAFSERESRDYDVIDILSILTCFNIYKYPNDGSSHPVRAYSAKQSILKLYEKNKDDYEKFRPILCDILQFHDIVLEELRDLYNTTGGKYGGLGIVEGGNKKLTFSGKKIKHALLKSALFPILASFRFFVEIDKQKDTVKWHNDFNYVVERFRELAPDLIIKSQNGFRELGNNPNALGKSRNHWARLHEAVSNFELKKYINEYRSQ